MRRVGAPLPLALKRRTRSSLLCLAVLVILGFTFLRDPLSAPQPVEDDGKRTSKFLEILYPWPRPKPTDGDIDTGIDMMPAIPPTLQDDDELEGDDDEGYSSGNSNGLPDHDWRDDGLLSVNLDGAHPIYELVQRAEKRWAEKHRKASKTLEQAVEEYERRYNRPPPKGFNHWWEYVQKHNVQLPDEYDQIHHDLEPYWGIDPVDLRAAQFEWEAHRDSFTLGKLRDEDVITVVNISLPEDRISDYLAWGAKPQMDLLTEVHQFIPPFRATFSPHDNPNELGEWTWKNAALEAAKKGTYVKPQDLRPMERIGWSAACPPDSPMYQNPPKYWDPPTPQNTKTFIHNHLASMDPCYHPNYLHIHGQFLSQEADPVPSRFTSPQFSNCATAMHLDIRSISTYQSDNLAKDDPRWGDKEDDRLFWRGSPTGLWHREGLAWRNSQRVRLVNLTRAAAPEGLDVDDARFAFIRYLRPTDSATQRVGSFDQRDRRRLNSALMDIGFAGKFQGCEGTACEEMHRELSWVDWVDQRLAGRYKYVFDVDGNGWSARFRRLMSSNALVFKATIYPEWWIDRVEAWVHYVPVQIDYSDLYDSLIFFGGDLSGEGAHDEMAKKIALAGREWVSKYWRQEDITAYMFRLWLEYARVMSIDRDSMSFTLRDRN